MSEPKGIARRCRPVARNFLRYSIHDNRIGFESDCFAILTPKGSVLIDPLPLAERELKRLEPVQAILLSGSCHQRSAWRYRKRFGVKVYAPKGGQGFEEKPDVFYGPGRKLPGGVVSVHVPGPTDAHYAFHRTRSPGVLICADLLTHGPGETLGFVPDPYQDAPAKTRTSVRKLLRRKFRILCFNHGVPVRKNAHAEIRKALERDRR